MLITNILQIRQELENYRLKGKKIAFVPTMGALHCGHLALVEKAKEVADIVVVSLFVNKTQFNDPVDYQKYPRTLESDLAQLEEQKVDYVFAPNEKEIYPNGDLAFKIIVTKFVDCLCGSSRPGHFDGVALIVAKLFNIINPDFAIFGEKDFQQVLVIKKLTQDLNFKTQILTHKTFREKSGLALSSRNQRLDSASLDKASQVYKKLTEIKSAINNLQIKSMQDLQNLLQKKSQELLNEGFEKIDYLEIRDEENLQLIEDIILAKNFRIFIAVYLQGVRLIDNLKI